MENQQPEALRLADKLKDAIQLLDLGFDEDIDPDELDKAALELEALHARVQELEAMLDAVGAGGVSAQRVTQGKDHIEREGFEAWWRENVSQGLADIDHDYRYWAIWQARAALSKDHIAQDLKMAAAEREANARLIAAAPEMLEALKWYENQAKEMGKAAIHSDSKRILELMQEIAVDYGKLAGAAIAKATGGADSGQGSQKGTI